MDSRKKNVLLCGSKSVLWKILLSCVNFNCVATVHIVCYLTLGVQLSKKLLSNRKQVKPNQTFI
jgi:hypothetical protein